MAHVSASPPLIPDGRISRVRLAAAAFPGGPSLASRGSSARSHTPLGCMVIPPARHPLRFAPRPGSVSRRCFLCGARHLPRAPLPVGGVTSSRAVSAPPGRALPRLRRSYWLMRRTEHLSSTMALASTDGSLQVAASPCWQTVRPDVISIVRAWALGPMPRHDLPLHVPVTSRETSASREIQGVRLVSRSLQCDFDRGGISGLQSFANVQAPMLARPPDRTHRRGIPRGSRAVYTTQWTWSHPQELWHRYVSESGN